MFCKCNPAHIDGQLKAIDAKVNAVLALLFLTNGDVSMIDVTALADQVAAAAKASADAVALIQNLNAQIAAHADDATKVTELTAQLKAAVDALSAAMPAPAAPAA